MRRLLKIVPPDEWSLIAPVMSEVFHNGMPTTPAQSAFQGAYDDGRLVGWLHIESLYHFNCMYLDAQYRQTGLGLKLIQEATDRIPPEHAAIWLTDRNANQIARLMGWRHIGKYNVYRKDV